MIYSKAVAHFSKALEEMVDVNAEKPWEAIETELKKAIMGDKTALEQVALMSDGILFSLSVATAMAESASEQEGARATCENGDTGRDLHLHASGLRYGCSLPESSR